MERDKDDVELSEKIASQVAAAVAIAFGASAGR